LVTKDAGPQEADSAEVAVVPLWPPRVVDVNAVIAVDVEEALGDLGLRPRNGRDDEEKMLESSFGRRQLQPTSTTGGCRTVKLPLLDALLDMGWQCTGCRASLAWCRCSVCELAELSLRVWMC
jgi:hypothetical protein